MDAGHPDRLRIRMIGTPSFHYRERRDKRVCNYARWSGMCYCRAPYWRHRIEVYGKGTGRWIPVPNRKFALSMMRDRYAQMSA